MTSPHPRLGVSWQISEVSGWGVFGWNLVAELLARGRPRPLLLTAPDPGIRNPRLRSSLAPLEAEQAELANLLRSRPEAVATLNDAVLLHHLGNDLQLSEMSRRVQGDGNVGVVFFESARLSAEALHQGSRFDHIVAGCSWNGETLRAHGLNNVSVVLQGVDTAVFHPAPRGEAMFPGRFVVFSGGKLEFRKGQDIALAAFRIFRDRHPEALLITLWHNLWLASSETIANSPYVNGPPAIGPDGQQRIAAWAEAHGVPADAFRDYGLVSNSEIAPLLRQADVAVFPNRCEGGTNLMAMECMACGIPTVLSANTGHLDLIQSDNCFALERQGRVPGGQASTVGWGESSVDELVEVLERVYRDRAEAARRGALGAAFLSGLSWRRQTEALLAAIGEI